MNVNNSDSNFSTPYMKGIEVDLNGEIGGTMNDREIQDSEKKPLNSESINIELVEQT